MKIVIYALGSGWGHLTRATALATALIRDLGSQFHVRILANSPYLDIISSSAPEFDIVRIHSPDDVAAHLKSCAALVVDTFPRGLMGELAPLLPTLAVPKFLIHRDVKPAYIAWANSRAFASDQYLAIFSPGEPGPLDDLPQAVATPPWIARAPQPVRDIIDVLVCASGNDREAPWYGEATQLLAGHTRVRCLAAALPPHCPPELWIQHWPAIDCIAAAGVVVGGAGYNTVYETAALNRPLIARPWPRKYDRQLLRARRSPHVTIVGKPPQAAAAALSLLGKEPAACGPINNGADDAAATIAALLVVGEAGIFLPV